MQSEEAREQEFLDLLAEEQADEELDLQMWLNSFEQGIFTD